MWKCVTELSESRRQDILVSTKPERKRKRFIHRNLNAEKLMRISFSIQPCWTATEIQKTWTDENGTNILPSWHNLCATARTNQMLQSSCMHVEYRSNARALNSQINHRSFCRLGEAAAPAYIHFPTISSFLLCWFLTFQMIKKTKTKKWKGRRWHAKTDNSSFVFRMRAFQHQNRQTDNQMRTIENNDGNAHLYGVEQCTPECGRREKCVKKKPPGKSLFSRMKNYTFICFLHCYLCILCSIDKTENREAQTKRPKWYTNGSYLGEYTRNSLTTAMYNIWHGIRASRNAIAAHSPYWITLVNTNSFGLCAHWFTLHQMPAREFVPVARTLFQPAG